MDVTVFKILLVRVFQQSPHGSNIIVETWAAKRLV